MIVTLGLDGLDYAYVTKFNCRNLMQCSYGRTDLSEFSELKTVVLWSSFLAETNMESDISKQRLLWNFKLSIERTFFSRFKTWKALDVPGFTYDEKMHQKERQKLKDFFEKKCLIEEYDQLIFSNYQKNKEIFLNMLNEPCDIQMGYFALADAIGHLSFGISSKMKIVYEELDELAGRVIERNNSALLIVSDHGMEAVGRFGDHSRYGFWSFSRPISRDNLRLPQLFKIGMDTCQINPKISHQIKETSGKKKLKSTKL